MICEEFKIRLSAAFNIFTFNIKQRYLNIKYNGKLCIQDKTYHIKLIYHGKVVLVIYMSVLPITLRISGKGVVLLGLRKLF